MKELNFKSMQPVFVMLSAVMASVLVCLMLYFYDNKYTWNARQPVWETLSDTKKDMGQPGRFLIEGWEFYPDQLLEPADFARDGMPGEGRAVSVGKLGRMDRYSDSRWTRGTFRLVFKLPETALPWAVSLPAVPSASRLYLNGRLAVQNGDPSIPCLAGGNRLFPVEGGGEKELILQVADLSSIHISMFSPPMAGAHREILHIRDVRILLNTVILVLAAVSGLLSFHMALILKWWRGFLFCLLCVCFLGYEALPFMSDYGTIGLQPWYALRIFSFYALLWLAVILENDLYRIRGGRISFVMGGLCVLALIYGCYVRFLPPFFSDVFRYMTDWYKFAVALYLILIANAALVEHMERSQTLLAMGTAFITLLFMEQALPYYEPVRGGTFTVIGCVVLMIGLLSILWKDMVDAYRMKETFMAETGRINRQLAMQKEHYKQLNARIEETRRLRHDMRHHVRMLGVLAGNGDVEKMKEYLRKLAPAGEQEETLVYTMNYALDAVLCHYMTAARQAGIRVNCQVAVPQVPCLPEEELCVLFGNLLENAVEACVRQEKGDRFIYLRCRQGEDRMSIVLDNSYDGNVSYQKGYFLSSKQNRVGVGVESVKAIVEKHRGTSSFVPGEEVFEVSIIIPLGLY